MPDIPIQARFISRQNGVFETDKDVTTYIAQETTNPVRLKGVNLKPGEKISLKDGDELVIPGMNEEGHDQPVVIVYANTEARINLWRNLQKASRDKLTNLTDRESFKSWWMQNRKRNDYREAVLFILDVDDFKSINDTLGHNAGDQALKIIADVLRNAVRYECQVCRWGGDEFVGIMAASPENARHRLEAIGAEVRKRTGEVEIPAGVSIGFVNVSAVPDSKNVAAMVELADQALYEIKKSGKNRVAEYQVIS